VDGYTKPLLHLFKETGWDGVEALTPKPVGDVTLEEIKRALDDEMVMIDGIPYIYFIRSMVRLFGDRLILDVSDELPPGGDVSVIRLVAEIIDRMKVLS